MLRYEYDAGAGGKRIVLIWPSEVVLIERSQVYRNIDYSFVTLSNGASVVVPKSPDVFAAEVEKELLAPKLGDPKGFYTSEVEKALPLEVWPGFGKTYPYRETDRQEQKQAAE